MSVGKTNGAHTQKMLQRKNICIAKFQRGLFEKTAFFDQPEEFFRFSLSMFLKNIVKFSDHF